MAVDDSDPLRPSLDRAKQALKEALGTACAVDLDAADTAELVKIEEALALANAAAQQAVSVRRRLAREPSAVGGGPAAQREIHDVRGARWAVFSVYPSTAHGRPTVRERFRGGWLSFDCGSETRRVAPIPADWQRLTDADLLSLCAQAEVVPRRAPVPSMRDQSQREIPS